MGCLNCPDFGRRHERIEMATNGDLAWQCLGFCVGRTPTIDATVSCRLGVESVNSFFSPSGQNGAKRRSAGARDGPRGKAVSSVTRGNQVCIVASVEADVRCCIE